MDEIRREQSPGAKARGRQTLKVCGRLTIEQAAGFREALVGALREAEEVEVDVSEVTAVDLSALQLLCASHRSAEQAGKRFELLQGGNELFRKVKNDAGFQRHIGCSQDTTHSCIWIEERNDG